MATSSIKVNLPAGVTPCHGKMITFKAPCDCEDRHSLMIDGKYYYLRDAAGNVNSPWIGRFKAGAMISVILDTESPDGKRYAYIQNGASISDQMLHDVYRGPYIITESCLFDLSTLGIKIGDTIHVICIGGGGGGIAGAGKDYDYIGDTSSSAWYVGGKGGTGFGAGGGGLYQVRSSSSHDNEKYGGTAGEKECITMIVDSLQVPVVIGKGGRASDMNNEKSPSKSYPGESTSFGTYLVAEGGVTTSYTGYTLGDGENGYISAGYAYASQDSDTKISGDGCVMIWW